ncbi:MULTISPECIES: 3D domain-containing protein [Clostridium]|uniref:3D (Asp-Asp-Asp) domain-containing protein n=2 Tax=Clostridium TaxID=1485 RepID=A0A1S8S9G5_CLOBE|nr:MULTISPECIES: 3D domain-containing protein [Clostridium]MBA8934869.1 3D (Asp-Asp-Asp) domain-containing protein [Clostridium beijerinckii]MBN7574559.1 3D domain-containing protein [Clostridium beijerinckii]MBN7579522.1 3D domain-containing protein [Clostridium beijerinckii]MBN7584120.1 3D domain-containing protein [Clostridium beijerinckii]MBO0520062.1 3D domain-containing protein [Clostridium beijerinckii]
MIKLKINVIKTCIFLGVCLLGFETNFLDPQTKNIQINRIVTGSYKEDLDFQKESTDTDKYAESVKKSDEVSSDSVNTSSVKNQKQVGKPIKAELTAYSDDPRCSGKWESQTAMQTRTRIGVIAAPSNIPLGSKMYIPELQSYKSDGMFDVEDRGGAIKVKKDGTYVIDVWVPSYEEAKQFGRKTTTIYLLE